MNDQERRDIYWNLYNYALRDEISEHLKRIEPETIKKAVENKAVKTLENIRLILENKEYDDPECFERVDALVMLYYRELGVDIHRHNELD